MRDEIMKLLDTAVDSVFEEMQRREGITSGDVPPLLDIMLQDHKKHLASVIDAILERQKGE